MGHGCCAACTLSMQVLRHSWNAYFRERLIQWLLFLSCLMDCFIVDSNKYLNELSKDFKLLRNQCNANA